MLAADDPLLSVLIAGPVDYGTVPAFTTVGGPAPFRVRAEAGVPRFVFLRADGEAAEGCLKGRWLLEVAQPDLRQTTHVVDDSRAGDASASWEPGEQIDLSLALLNDGLIDADPVDATLSFRGPPVAGVSILVDNAGWAPLAAGGPEGSNLTPFVLAADAALGPRTRVPLSLDVRIGGALHKIFELDLTVGGFPQGTLEWSFPRSGTFGLNQVTPLVLQLTDDDDDGVITECDIPDIVAVHYVIPGVRTLLAMSGDSGAIHWELIDDATNTRPFAAIAGGDVNKDGWNEIIVANRDGYVSAISSDGVVLWTSEAPAQADQELAAVGNAAIAPQVWDLDGDGTVEVIAGLSVYDGADGSLEWEHTDANRGRVLIGDFDLDGKMEILADHVAYRADGSVYAAYPWSPYVGINPSLLVNLDDEPYPELVVGGWKAWNHDGTLFFPAPRVPPYPLGPPCAGDFDGDGAAEIAVAYNSELRMYDNDGRQVWATPTDDASGAAGCSVFDFDGDGPPEIVYRDENILHVIDGATGEILWQTPVRSGTANEYPIIADVDNDGSAEIVVLDSNVSFDLHVFGNPAWASARQVWNQEDYRVTHVTDTGQIVSQPFPRYLGANDFRGQDPGRQLACICEPPAVSFEIHPSCGSLSVCFTATGAGGARPYALNWDFGDGSPAGSGATPCHTYASEGDYGVRVELSDDAGCGDHAERLVHVRALLSVDFTPPTGCADASLCFAAGVTGGLAPYELTWDFDDGSVVHSRHVARCDR